MPRKSPIEPSNGHSNPSPDPTPRRARISEKDKLFASLVAASPEKDVDSLARQVGYRQPGLGSRLVIRLSDLIASERAKLVISSQMELDEALKGVAAIARDPLDPKTRLAALRTILQVHGVLSDKALPEDRIGAARQVESLVESLRRRLSKGSKLSLKVASMELSGLSDTVDSSNPASPVPIELLKKSKK